MPTVRDGTRTVAALRAAGVDGVLCADVAELCHRIEAGAGAALLPEEALARDRDGRLADVLRRQPPWSDFPLVLLARQASGERPRAYRESLNVSLVERPVRIRSLLSVVRAALRARRHQYRVRDHLRQEARHAERVRENEERLEFALSAGRLGWWDLDLARVDLRCSTLCKQHYGQPIDRPLTYETWLGTIHPDDRARVDAAALAVARDRVDYDVEYRVVWPDRTVHWILVRGRASYAADGMPVRISGVSLDVTDRRRDEEALRAADRKKDDFLAVLAHELRNPLAPITNALQTMRRTTEGALRERCEAIMQRQLVHMVRLIDDLLDVSRINRNKMELRRAPITVAEVVTNAVETVRPMIEAAGHDLTIALPDAPLVVDGDLTRLAQVFANLLMNSAKYTERGGRIRLEARRDATDVVVTVRDTGIGISREALPTIFDMFSQVDRSLERSTGGLGIGLGSCAASSRCTVGGHGVERGAGPRRRVPRPAAGAGGARRGRGGGRRRPSRVAAGAALACARRRRQPRLGGVDGGAAPRLRQRGRGRARRSRGGGARRGRASRDRAHGRRDAASERPRGDAPHSRPTVGPRHAHRRAHGLGTGRRSRPDRAGRMRRTSREARDPRRPDGPLREPARPRRLRPRRHGRAGT